MNKLYLVETVKKLDYIATKQQLNKNEIAGSIISETDDDTGKINQYKIYPLLTNERDDIAYFAFPLFISDALDSMSNHIINLTKQLKEKEDQIDLILTYKR